MSFVSILPAVNAALNASSCVLLLIGHGYVRRGKLAAHRAFMIAAVCCSALFFVSYIYFHSQVGNVRFQGVGWIRPVYFAILISHTILAVLLVPLVLVTLTRGLRGRYERHKSIARITYPVWLYVSVTGVVIYFMLYRWFA